MSIELKKVSSIVGNTTQTRYMLKLPEYKSEIIIKAEHIQELLTKIVALQKVT